MKVLVEVKLADSDNDNATLIKNVLITYGPGMINEVIKQAEATEKDLFVVAATILGKVNIEKVGDILNVEW